MIKFSAELDPVPQNGAGFGKGNVFQSKRVTDYKKKLAWIARAAMQGRPPFTGALRSEIHFYRNFKNLPNKNFGDYDNLLKAMNDPLNKIVWNDDSQILTGQTFKHLSKTPHVDFFIGANCSDAEWLCQTKSTAEILNHIRDLIVSISIAEKVSPNEIVREIQKLL